MINKVINNRYQIEKKLGQGSFAAVYLGHDIKSDAKVAIKIVEKTVLKLCEFETKVFKIVSGLPHFPILYWSGMYEKKYCFVMQLLGDSLTDYMKSTNFSLSSICDLGLQVITALEILHSKGYIHRDLKPENIILDVNVQNYYYLIDYGLSRKFIDPLTKHHAPLREDTTFMGNLAFCSNNILSGISASRRDDLESLGLLIIYIIKKDLP